MDTRELIEGSLQEIEGGNRAVESASSSIGIVVDGIKQIADVSKQLSIMIGDQSETMRQAEQGVSQISDVVQNNSAAAQATTLDDLVGQFTFLDE